MADHPDQALKVIQFSSDKYSDQAQCNLFTIIPAEIRDRIFSYALADYEDHSQPYEHQTCYRRPNYFAPRHSDTAILRTCQRIYNEAWFRPWTGALHTFYLTAADRCPTKVTTVAKMQPCLDLLHALHGDVEVDDVRIFSQLCNLENGHRLNLILQLQHFRPLRVTITIRHTDWWFWESDQPLRIAARWVSHCRFPSSVRAVCMELETLERKRTQVTAIATQMIEKWQFQRSDGMLLSARNNTPPYSVLTWSGTSIWGGKRWVRDETPTKPETLDYCVVTVTWRPLSGNGLDITQLLSSLKLEDSSDYPPAPDLHLPYNYAPMAGVTSFLLASDMQAAGLPEGTSAPEAVAQVQQWRTEELARRRARGDGRPWRLLAGLGRRASP